MNIVIVVAIIVAVLFAVTYFTRRRFGVLGLALCAGFLISEMWTGEVTPFIRGAGFDLFTPPLSSVVAACLVLLPAVVLLLNGPTYHRKTQRLIGAGIFALLALAFMLDPLGDALVLDETGEFFYSVLMNNKTILITAGIVYALYDVLTLRTPKRER